MCVFLLEIHNFSEECIGLCLAFWVVHAVTVPCFKCFWMDFLSSGIRNYLVSLKKVPEQRNSIAVVSLCPYPEISTGLPAIFLA